MVATAVTLNDHEGHSPLADVFKCNPSNICGAFYTISTDDVLAWLLCISTASCQITGNVLNWHTVLDEDEDGISVVYWQLQKCE